MPESRDRLSRAEDVAAVFARRRLLVQQIGILQDEPLGAESTLESPFQQRTPGPVRVGSFRVASRFGRGYSAAPRTGIGSSRNLTGRENTPRTAYGRRSRGRSTSSVLPFWYPRVPLQDVTTLVRAIERRRARFRGTEGEESGALSTATTQEPTALDISPSAHLEHNPTVTPTPTIGTKYFPASSAKVPKILLDVTNQTAGGESDLTPQKRLLNSIYTVEKAVKEELRKMKRTPSAKKAEREKRVRTLMSMR